MNTALRTRIILVNSLFLACLFGDQITLTNGDTITGAIIKKDGDRLTMKGEFLGEITVPWTAIKAIKSDQPLFVALANGTEVSGAITTQGESILIAATPNPQSTGLNNVSAIRDEAEEKRYERLLKPRWLELWAGYFDLGCH